MSILKSGCSVVRWSIVLFLTLFNRLFAAEAQEQAFILQGLLIGDSPAPQDQGELQTVWQTGLGKKSQNTAFDAHAAAEYGLTNNFWLGATLDYGFAASMDEIDHSWEGALETGYAVLNLPKEKLVFSGTLAAGYDEDGVHLKPALAFFKGFGHFGINLSGGPDFHPLKPDLETPTELAAGFFFFAKNFVPALEIKSEFTGTSVKTLLAPGIFFLTLPKMELGIGAKFDLLDPSQESGVIISLVKAFET